MSEKEAKDRLFLEHYLESVVLVNPNSFFSFSANVNHENEQRIFPPFFSNYIKVKTVTTC